MRIAQDIINDARFKLTTHIITLMRKLDAYFTTGDRKLMTSSELDVVIDSTSLRGTPSVRVLVDDTYEDRLIDFLATTDDHNFYVGVYSGVEEDDVVETDIDADALSTDELLAIAKCLEKTYEKIEEE